MKPNLEIQLDAVMDRADEVLNGLRGGSAVQRPLHYLNAAALFDRCHSLYGAIRHLLSRNFTHEAAMLLRALFTDSLFLTELGNGDERRRAELLIGWELATIADWEGMAREAVARGLSDGAELEDHAHRRLQIQEYVRRTGLFREGEMPRNVRPDANVKQLADAHGRGDAFLDYRVMHHFVHGSTFATRVRFSRSTDASHAEDVILIGGPAADVDTYRLGAGLMATDSVLLAARALCLLVKRQEPVEIASLLSELERISEEENRRFSASSAASG